MNFALSAATMIVVLLSALIYGRGSIIGTFYFNAPGRFTEVHHASYDFKHVHVADVRNCEDIFLNDSEKWAILSCDPGRDTWNTVMGTFVNPVPAGDGANMPMTGLFLYRYIEDTLSKIDLISFEVDPSDFHPLGIEYDRLSRSLFVVNHAFSGTRIEVFTLQQDALAAAHVKTTKHPLIATPNSILALSATELLVTNDHHFQRRTHPLLSQLETFTSLPGGTVTYVRLSDDLEVLDASVVARTAFANGIAALNSTHIAVASSSAASIRLYELQRKHAGVSLEHKTSLSLPFIPDNLSVDREGVLLIAGHPHAPSLTKIAENARFCSPDDLHKNVTLDSHCQRVRQSYMSWVMSWTPSIGLTTIYAGKDTFGTSTTAVWDTHEDVGIVTGLYERGLLQWKRRSEAL